MALFLLCCHYIDFTNKPTAHCLNQSTAIVLEKEGDLSFPKYSYGVQGELLISQVGSCFYYL